MKATSQFFPDRDSGLARLHEFVPRAGRDYARTRNYDFGPQNRANISQLSPWLRHRLIDEEEVLSAVLAQHSEAAAEKFIQEVCWRTYWKGWLEMRPQVWRDYHQQVGRFADSLKSDELERYRRATAGDTGIDCFDAWSNELTSIGYLHNHARMWFASIWIFTLRLPWELGADFFMRNLLDGDAASNTLSWRWVAGLQTRGKTYLARSSNIAKYTEGRFDRTPGLETDPPPIDPPPVMQPRALPTVQEPERGLRTAILLTDDDLLIDDAVAGYNDSGLVISVDASPMRSPSGVAAHVSEFVSGAFDDAERRLSGAATRMSVRTDGREASETIAGWCRDNGVEQLLSARVPTGPSRDAMRVIAPRLQAAGVRWAQTSRAWDTELWPFATKGFFRFKKNIPAVLAARGLTRSEKEAERTG